MNEKENKGLAVEIDGKITSQEASTVSYLILMTEYYWANKLKF